MENPYQPPKADTAPTPVPSGGALYTPRTISVCCFIFTPLVGGILSARNFRRRGEPVKARNTLLAGIGALVGLVIFGAVLPESAERVIRPVFFGINYGLAMAFSQPHRVAFQRYVADGGKAASPPWGIIAIGILLYVGLFALMIFGNELESTSD